MYNGNACTNDQAATFSATEEGEKILYIMGETTMIEGTKAILNRRGDLLQAIVETTDPAKTTMGDETPDPSVDSGASTVGAVSGCLILISALAAACIE